MRIVIFLLMAAGLLLAGCAADPRDAAEAEAIKLEAQAEANARAQELYQEAQRFELRQAEAEAVSAQVIQSVTVVILWAGYAMAAAVAVVILAAAVGALWGTIGTGRAMSEFTHNRANLIPLDVHTRQYPAMIQHIGRGRFSLTDINTGQVIFLDSRNAGDRQLIAAAGAVRLAGAVAFESRKSEDAAGVALVGTNPAIVAPAKYQALPQPVERVERFEVIPQPVKELSHEKQ